MNKNILIQTKKSKDVNKFIYTITAIQNIKINYKRCFGYYFNEDEAIESVLDNELDIREANNEYIIIEQFHIGLYTQPEKEIWFKWDNKKKCYQSCDKPTYFNNVCNFGMG